jgi:hypothetical protein
VIETLEKFTTKFSARGLEKSDADLIAACRRGDQSAWNEPVDRFKCAAGQQMSLNNFGFRRLIFEATQL